MTWAVNARNSINDINATCLVKSALPPGMIWYFIFFFNVSHYGPGLTDEVLPLGVQISLVGQAALHDVGAVVGAGFDGGQAATVGAVDHLHQGLRALWAERNLGRGTAGVRETQRSHVKPQSYIFYRLFITKREVNNTGYF